MSIYWKAIGGAILSTAALGFLTVYQQFNRGINDLRRDLTALNTDIRKDLGRLGEGAASMAKKEDVSTRSRSMWDALKELRSEKHEVTALKERCSILLKLFEAGEEERRQLAKQIETLREQQSRNDQREEMAKEVQKLRERIARLQATQTGAAVTPAMHHE